MKTKNSNLKRFVVRKYIYARDAHQAISLDKKTKVHDVWIDEDWKKEKEWNNDESNIGFGSKP